MKRLSFEKVFYHMDNLYDFIKRGDTYPVHIIVGLSNVCNHQCIWCYAEYETQKKINKTNGTHIAFADKKIVLQILREAYDLGCKSVSLVGTGEPLLHKDAAEIILGIKEIGLDVGIYTNGVMLKNKIVKAVIESCTFLRVSCSASNDEELMRLHRARKGDFDKITKNIIGLLGARKPPFPTIGVQFAVSHRNYTSVLEAAKHWKDIGVDYFSIKPVYKNSLNLEHEDNLVPLGRIKELMEEVKLLSNDQFHVYAKVEQFDTVLLEKENSRNYTKCYGHSFCTALLPDATLYLCGNLHGRKEFELGNVVEKGGFKAVWDSDKRKKIITSLDLGICPVGCRMHPLNKILWDLKYPDPLIHPNFL